MTDQHIEQRLQARMPDSWNLMNDMQKLACTIAYSIGHDDGYDAGFECATIASTSIITAQKRFDTIDIESAPAPTFNDKLDTSTPPGADSFEPIAGIDFKAGVDGLFDAVKVICEDHKAKTIKL